MINVTNDTYNAMQNNTDFREAVIITLEDGTQITATERDIIVTGNQITSGAGGSAFPLGQAMGRTYTIVLSNIDGKYSDYDFYGAKISLTLAYNNGTATERISYGTYTVITPETEGDIITISGADDMYKADVPYSTSQTFPAQAGVVLADACQSVGIALQTASFTGDDFIIKSKPECTVRELIGGIAFVAGGNALINYNNRLEIRRYSMDYVEGLLRDGTLVYSPWEQIPSVYGGIYNPWDTGDSLDGGLFSERRNGCHFLYAWTTPPTIDTDDITITGVSANGEGDNTFFSGTPGYVIKTDTPVIEGNEEDALMRAGAAVIGLRFRAFSGSYIGDPTIEPMDQCIVMDKEGNAYQSIVTDVTYNIRGTTELKNSAEPRIRANGSSYSSTGGTIQRVRRLIRRNLSAYDIGVQNLAALMTNAIGYYETKEVQADGSIIRYMHDKPTLAESQIVYKETAQGFAGSTDGGQTWSYGRDNLGNAVMNTVAAKGISFDWAIGGAINIAKNGREVFYADATTGACRMNPDLFTMSGQDYALDAAISSVIEWILEEFPLAVGDRVETYYQDTDPSTSWGVDTSSHYGDMWYDTGHQTVYIWAAGEGVLVEPEWQVVEDPPPLQIFDRIKGHRTIYVTATVSPPYSVGDMWYKDSRAFVAQHGRVSGEQPQSGDWVGIIYQEDSTIYSLDEELNSTEEIFNRLTNNGQVKGLFLRDVIVDGQTVKQLYISFDYAEGGTLKLGRGGKVYGNLVVFGGVDAQTQEELKIVEVTEDGITVCTEGSYGVEYFDIKDNIIKGYSSRTLMLEIDLTANIGSTVKTSYWQKNGFVWKVGAATYEKMSLGSLDTFFHNERFTFNNNSGVNILAFSRAFYTLEITGAFTVSAGAFDLASPNGEFSSNAKNHELTSQDGSFTFQSAGASYSAAFKYTPSTGAVEILKITPQQITSQTNVYQLKNSDGTKTYLNITASGANIDVKTLTAVCETAISISNTAIGSGISIEPHCGNIRMAPQTVATMDSDGRKHTTSMVLKGMNVLVDTEADHYWELGDTTPATHTITLRSSHINMQVYSGVGSSSHTNVVGVASNGVAITGDLSVSGTINGTVAQSSDRRLKKNLAQMEDSGLVDGLRVYSFDWKTGGHCSAGLIAQELKEACPELVEELGGGYLGINYTGIVPHLIAKIQAQERRIKKLDERLERLERIMIRNG